MLLMGSTFGGVLAFGGAYLVTHHFDLSAGIELDLLVVRAWRDGAPPIWIGYAVLLFLSIPAK